MHDQILSWVMIGSLCQCSSEFTDSVALLTPYVLGYLGADFKLRRLGCGWDEIPNLKITPARLRRKERSRRTPQMLVIDVICHSQVV